MPTRSTRRRCTSSSARRSCWSSARSARSWTPRGPSTRRGVRRQRAAELTPPGPGRRAEPVAVRRGPASSCSRPRTRPARSSAAVIGVRRRPADGIVVVVHHAGGAPQQGAGRRAAEGGRREVTRATKLTKRGERADFVRAEVRRAGGTIDADAVGVADRRRRHRPAGAGRRGGAARRRHRRHVDARGRPPLPPRPCRGDGLRRGRQGRGRRPRRRAGGAALGAGARRRRRCWSPTRWPTACARSPSVGAAGRGDPNRLAGELGMPPWKIRKAQSQVRGWGPEALAVARRAGRGGQRRRQGRRAGPRLRPGTGRPADVRGPRAAR